MDTNEPAFPFTDYGRDSCGEVVPRDTYPGMTVRDYFAAKAISAIIVQHRSEASEMANDAYEIADALLERRQSENTMCDWVAMNDNPVTMYRSLCDKDARWEHLPIWYKHCPMCGKPVNIKVAT